MPRKEPADEPNPYGVEQLQIHRLRESDPKAAIEAVAPLRKRIEDEIERERRAAHEVLADHLLDATPSQAGELVKDFVRKWIDIPARLYLFENEDAEPYIKLLGEYLLTREAPIWDVLAPAVGGDDALKMIVSGRVSHWKAKALELARTAVDKKSSPKALIDAFMEREGIRSYDGRDGFTEKYPVIGRDTLLAVKDEARWVSKATYRKLAEIIGCMPEQLHPRRLSPPRRKRMK